MKVQVYPSIPDAAYAKGVSAPFCGSIDGTLIVAGGANFPDLPLLEGGSKKVYDDIWALDGKAWSRIGHLSDSLAYGASFGVEDGLVLAGGNSNGRTVSTVQLLRLENGKAVLEDLPALPEAIEQAGASVAGDRLFLLGGVGTDGIWSCRIGEYRWECIARLPEPLVQPLCFAHFDPEKGYSLYFWGGFNPETLAVSPAGYALRHFFPGAGDVPAIEQTAAIPDDGTFVGASGVSLPDGRLSVIGGVNRSIFARALHNTPEDRIPYLSQEPAAYRFRQEVFVFDPVQESWSSLGTVPETALAGAGVTLHKGAVAVAGGECKPGVRSPLLFSLNF